MNRYLTEKAQKKRWWDIPLCVLSALFTVAVIEAGIDSFSASAVGASLIALLVAAGIAAVPLWLVVRRMRRQSLARKIAKACDMSRDDNLPADSLDKRFDTKDAAGKIRRLLSKGFLQNMAFDVDGKRLLLAGKPWNQSGPGGGEMRLTGNDEYDAKLRDIRQLNDDIHNWKVSAKIERIEELSAGIFRVLDEKPERADDARRFMNYYLPTTIKLLESYKLMEGQTYQGENIQLSRKKIEDVLDTMIDVMQKQQDRLFSHDVMDVETDITVLETLMSADGFSDKNRLPREAGGH